MYTFQPEVRLVNGSNHAKGRVEFLYSESWRTVCGASWDLRDVRVVCRILGFDGALAASRSARFGQGAGDVLRVDCWGTEDSLADCPYFGASIPCGHHMDAAHPNPFQVRLVNGSDSAKGRVEVLRDGSWGTVCGVGWDLRDARVVCRMLGFDGALDAPGSARFGQGSVRILLDRVNCDGTEDNLAECGYSGNARYSCSHTSDAGAMCYSGDPFKVRLVGGSNDAEGRVELMHGRSWGTICDDSWDLRDARVVCRMLGFGGALDAPGSARFGQGSGRIILDVVGCDGTEVNVAECIHRGIGVHYCGHDEDAGAICYNGAHPNPLGIRLVDGSSKAEGRVEVFYDGSWGTICDNGWDLRDARVVCRMLGFEGALDAPTSARFGQGSGDILLNLVGCDGTEGNLADCAHLGLGVNYCGHEEDAGAICYSGAHPNSVGLRLVGGSNSTEGRVEIRYNGTWGTVCDDGWDLQDANVVCRMLGFGNASTAPGSAQFGEGNEDIFLSHVGCDGTEDNLADCAHLGFGVHNCQHNEDAGVTCLIGATDDDVKADLNLSQYITKGEPHKYMDMNTVYETPGNEKDFDLDGYILPTRDALSDDRVTATADQFRDDKSYNHEYTDMKTVYQTPSAGKDVDLDGYLLP
ncbi:deleted in malignant brain tumors 1 protein-like [Strongylocentrotus purpuratus]|uniref:SRCR domain-containing protein n=1 Tax=Strongylocentrotus purpuratus TaxID=7668 RepID=A0A7M7T3P9_STRPU|nr:deleted in malignant brain tumors 1 protein-like [Strongylocentrotus purpuratus]